MRAALPARDGRTSSKTGLVGDYLIDILDMSFSASLTGCFYRELIPSD
jgi:hypothetical protein